MAIYKYGTQDVMPQGYQPIRDILAGMGYGSDKVGWNPQTKNPIVMGNELDASKLLFGSDQRYYATPEILNPMLAGLGLMTSPQQKPSTPSYQSPYDQQLKDLLDKVLNRPSFEYDASSDPAWQQASKQIQEKIMLNFTKRNMLYSPATGEAVGEGLASALPQFEQAAYARYQDEGSNLYNMLNVVMSLDERSYNMYRDAVEDEYREWEKNRTIRLDELDAQYKRMDYAYKKLDELEEADNEIASILGIPVGTKSQTAKARAEEMKNKLEMMKLEEEQRIRQEQRALANEKSMLAYRESLDKKKAEEKLGTPDQMNAYYEFLNIYAGQARKDSMYLNNPYAAYQNILAKRKEHVELIGEKLYNQLLNDVVGMMDMQKDYAPKQTSYGPDNYKENPVYHEQMSYARSYPQEFIDNFNVSSQEYYNEFGSEGAQNLYKTAQDQLGKGKTDSQTEKYKEYYRMAESDPKGFKKLMNDKNKKTQILDEVGIEYYEKLKDKAAED